jgi:hypothetical protein
MSVNEKNVKMIVTEREIKGQRVDMTGQLIFIGEEAREAKENMESFIWLKIVRYWG